MTTPGTQRGFQDQLHDLWRTRPTRLPSGSPVAGVCAGIGYRYRVDPVLVRVAFVVATIFGGSGILLYLAGWLLLTKEGDSVSAAESLVGKGDSSDSTTKTVVLIVALAIAVSVLGPAGIGLGGSGVIGLGLMLGGLWLLYQREPIPPAGVAQPAAAFPVPGYPVPGYPIVSHPAAYSPYTKLPDHYEPDAPADPAATETSGSTATETSGSTATETSAPTQGTASAGQSATNQSTPNQSATNQSTTQPGQVTHDVQPPSWDPLGVAPFAWDLPEPAKATPTPVIPDTPKSRLAPITIGLAIIAAAIATGISVGSEDSWLTPGRIGAIALAVVGVGLLLGAVLRRGYGLLVVTAPLAGFVVLASLVGPLEFDARNMGNHVWTPANAAAVEDEYTIKFGSGTLDLTNTDLDADTTVDVSSRFGDLVVILPPDMNVIDHCDARFGHALCLTDGTIDGGSDGTDGPVLTINAQSRFGSVEVFRG
ncbi:MAG: PspC domain-containing protein [Rhodococcus sp.]|nr:PspC domain-containing protein [Rhodococcus sp. (in: high G+C Gram-positive bacteria)]